MPRILSVVAPANGSGKTSLIVTLLRAHPGAFTALKASTVYGDGRYCPRSPEVGCACRRLVGEYTLIQEPEVLGKRGTDTGRMIEAGAGRTLWCLAKPGCHARMWGHLERKTLRGEECVLAEGTGILEVMKPESIVMVASPWAPRERWKESTWPLMRRADLVIVNRADGRDGAAAGSLAGEIERRTGRAALVQDVTAPLGAWTDGTLARLAGAFLGRALRP